MVYFVAALILVNIVLWIIFLIRFRKLFNTEKIIEKTQNQMNKLVADIDKATDRDMYLSGEATKRIQTKIDEAERTMELFNEATKRLRNMIAEADKINKMTENKSFINLKPEDAFEVKLSKQGELFDNSSSEIKVTQDGAAYREVPVLNTKIYDEEAYKKAQPPRPVMSIPSETKPEKPGDFNNNDVTMKVKQLFDQGYKVEEIATKLSRSVTEIQFIIDMNF